MGRKAKFSVDDEERQKTGKGRKSKKQSDPEAPFQFTKRDLKGKYVCIRYLGLRVTTYCLCSVY